MTPVKRAIASTTIVTMLAFIALSWFLHPAYLFLLTAPLGVALYGGLSKPKPLSLPSVLCPACSGEWGPWGRVERTGQYHTIDDRTTVYHQTRTCKECGFAESRKVR